MTDRLHRDDARTTRAAGSRAGHRLARLDDLDDFEIADGEPDIRGWSVKTADGREVGEVENLIADPDAMEVRYLEVKVKHELLGTKDDEQVLVPISQAQLHEDDDTVLISALSASRLRETPRFGRASLTAENDRALYSHYGQEGPSSREDQNRFFGKRRRGRDNAAYLTRSEEQLAVGRTPVKRGEVDVHKSVETRHVEKTVPTMHEEVHVDRRPAQPGMSSAPRISEDEVRIPVMSEEVVVEKRTVPKEEIVISKTAERDTKTVEADLRRERVDVERKGKVEDSPRG
jgi:uncharacterized protein (TIGR02271 family)